VLPAERVVVDRVSLGAGLHLEAQATGRTFAVFTHRTRLRPVTEPCIVVVVSAEVADEAELRLLGAGNRRRRVAVGLDQVQQQHDCDADGETVGGTGVASLPEEGCSDHDPVLASAGPRPSDFLSSELRSVLTNRIVRAGLG